MIRLALLLLGLLLAAGPVRAVGFQQMAVPDPADRSIEVGIWYPSEAVASPHPLGPFRQTVAPDGALRGERLPVVVVSHGTGGSLAGHWDTAWALADAGFVALALSHTGDNVRDQRYTGAHRLAERTRQLKRVLDWLLAEWPGHGRLDAGRVGAFGYSAGGFTVLVSAGGLPDLSRGPQHCATQPMDAVCQLIRSGLAEAGRPVDWVREPRIRAVVAAAPGPGWAFTGRSLAALEAPVQLWRAAADEVLTHPWHAELVRRALPRPPEMHVVPQAGHYAFLAPCPDRMAAALPELCLDPEGFDRVAFHGTFNAAVVGFFQATLR